MQHPAARPSASPNSCWTNSADTPLLPTALNAPRKIPAEAGIFSSCNRTLCCHQLWTKKSRSEERLFCTIRAEISSRQRWQQQKRLPKQQRQLPKRREQLPKQRERLPKRQKRLPKQPMQLQQLVLVSCRKRPEPWQRSAKPAGATFSCLCPQKECQKTGDLGTMCKTHSPIAIRDKGK